MFEICNHNALILSYYIILKTDNNNMTIIFIVETLYQGWLFIYLNCK